MTNPPQPPDRDVLPGEPEQLRKRLENMRGQARRSEVRRVAAEGELQRLSKRAEELQRALERRDEDLARARQELEETALELQQARRVAAQRQREGEQVVNAALAALRSIGSELDRIESSSAWRVGHRAAAVWSRVRLRRPKTRGAVDATRRRLEEVVATLETRRGDALALPAPRSGLPLLPPGRPAQAGAVAVDSVATGLAAMIRERIERTPSRVEWPSVTAVMVLRSGDAIESLVSGLNTTDYPSLEIVAVVADSVQDPPVLPRELGLAFPNRVAPASSSLAGALNDAVDASEFPLIAFLDGVTPFEPGWLKELVDGLLVMGNGALGATVLQPPRAEADSIVVAVDQQGRVLARDASEGLIRGARHGEPILSPGFGIEIPSAALSRQCMVIERETFLNVGGFDTGYRDGLEDVELCLQLAGAGGRVACSGRAFVLGGAQAAGTAVSAFDQRRLRERWGPAIRRQLREGLARRDRRWVDEEVLRIALVRRAGDEAQAGSEVGIARELGVALNRLGHRVDHMEPPNSWQLEPLDPGVDAVVVFDPGLDPAPLPAEVTAIALIRGEAERWLAQPHFDRYEILLCSTSSAGRRIYELTGREATPFPPATDPARFGGAHFAQELACDYALLTGWEAGEEFEQSLLPRNGELPALYGGGWRRRGRLRRFGRDTLPEERLPAAYASAKLVIVGLGDQRAEAELDPSAIDALAAGALVMTPHAAEAKALFDDEFPTFSSPDTLRAELDSLLGSAERRIQLSRRYRRKVLAEHTYDQRARRLRELITATDERLSFCLKIGAPDWAQATTWGDLYLARDMQRALKRRGHRCLIQVRSGWHEPAGFSHDVVVHLRGRHSYTPRPGQFNVLWLISHPTELAIEDANAFDLVCVASGVFAEDLRDRVSVPVAILDQATDPWRFFPDPDRDLVHDIAFVGNSRGARRSLLDDIRGIDRDLAVWGAGLADMVDPRHLKGDWFPNEALRKVYSSAKVVICDHWPDMRQRGFISNRLYDAVASGAVVISDSVAGLDERFGEAVVTYDSPDELRGAIDRLLDSAEERARRAAGARDRIVRAHTFDHRVEELLRLVAAHAAASGHRLRVAA